MEIIVRRKNCRHEQSELKKIRIEKGIILVDHLGICTYMYR